MRYHEIRELVETYSKTKRASLKGKRLENNTYAIALEDDVYAVRLHETNIVVFNPDNTIELHTGGWKTSTTKDRICRYANVRMWQRESSWFIRLNEKTSTIFHDGLTVVPLENGDFDCINMGKSIPGINDTEANTLKTKRRVKAYIAAYVDSLMQGLVPTPSFGDCWLCLAANDGKTFTSYDHILSHIDEMYFVPTLAVSAMKYACVGDNMIAWLFEKMAGRTVKAYDNFGPRTLSGAMRRYIYRSLNIAT